MQRRPGFETPDEPRIPMNDGSRGSARAAAVASGVAPEAALEGHFGLTAEEAALRLRSDGPNELGSDKARTGLHIALDVVREPMLALLVVAGILYLLLGQPSDAWVLVGFVVVVIVITVVQERRTERALEALRELSSPRALVVRDGRRTRIAGRDVVRGDVVLLVEGDRVPADAILRRARNLSVDEALLTGESAPVGKLASSTAATLETPGGDGLSSVFAGTLVTAGHGLAEVVATGPRSELGRIGGAIRGARSEPTRLQSDTRRLVRWFALAGLATSVAIAVVYASTRGGSALAWKEGALAGIAAAMSLLPEEFGVVLSIYLAIGAWRLARRGVLARRMPAVEALGETTVLCADKTGTLTQNRMSLAVLHANGEEVRLEGADRLSTRADVLLGTAALASRREGFDPMDRAIHESADGLLGLAAKTALELVREYPLAPELPAMTRAWRRAGEELLVVACKGAPEAVASLCRLGPQQRAELLAEAARLARSGRRVLAVAGTNLAEHALPAEQRSLELDLVGLLGFEDPLRASVPAAVAECRRAGIRVVMVTGDHPATAQAMATRAGIEDPQAILLGSEIEASDDAELARRVEGVGVFARVVPEQKLRIVRAFIARGEIVAMTGDGVNDAPALRAAHVGVAMGGRGTDVAREAAGLVLLDDEFTSIVGGVRMGRRIHDNIQHAMVFIVAVHVPIAAMTLGQALVPALPLLLLPVHLAFLELVIDPTCSLVFEAEEADPDIMERPPRPRDQPLLTRANLALALGQGLCALAACVAVLLYARRDHPPDAARALAFTTLVVAILVLMLANRSNLRARRSRRAGANRAVWFVVGGTIAMLVCVLFVPGAQRLFRFAPLHADDLALAVGAGLASLGWLWLLPFWKRQDVRSPGPAAG
jgi:Ca2+-transporting ATPase